MALQVFFVLCRRNSCSTSVGIHTPLERKTHCPCQAGLRIGMSALLKFSTGLAWVPYSKLEPRDWLIILEIPDRNPRSHLTPRLDVHFSQRTRAKRNYIYGLTSRTVLSTYLVQQSPRDFRIFHRPWNGLAALSIHSIYPSQQRWYSAHLRHHRRWYLNDSNELCPASP